MIGIDTNVLVRFLVQDDPEQSARATAAMTRLSADDPGYLTTVVLVETYWVLTRAYKNSAGDVIGVLSDLINSDGIVVQDEPNLVRALELASRGADLPDALIAAGCRAKGCSAILSFDQRAVKALGFSAP